MSTVYVALPNKDRSVLPSQSGTGNYTVQLAETLSFSQGCEVFLVSCKIPYVWYNISKTNNTLFLDKKKVHLSPGNYDSIPDLVEAIEKLGIGQVTVDPASLRVTIDVPKGKTLSGPLLDILGFSKDVVLKEGPNTSRHLADINGGRDSLLIYLNIIENTNVGSYLVPLLATIGLGNHRYGDIINYSPTGPDYLGHLLKTHSFRSIEVDIRDTHGNEIDFNDFSLSVTIGIRHCVSKK